MDVFSLTDPLSNVATHSIGSKLINGMSGFFQRFRTLHYYFDINDTYLINKSKILLFPFLVKNWRRTKTNVSSQHDKSGYKPPKDDIHAPDLYIPLIFHVATVILASLEVALNSPSSSFSMDFGKISSFFLLYAVIQIIFSKLILYVFSIPFTVLDLFALLNYRLIFPSIYRGFRIINSFLFRSNISFILNKVVLIYCCAVSYYFIFRVLHETSSSSMKKTGNNCISFNLCT
eukprot:TRINITY_DN1966_c0_g1_i1.p1 TRINITY_DN1966_c0_g1~~TRINITY_DN1966_c0_g1_i1.p1  ORF type:complete len:232 (+),score=19.59 TRINITY_DN1966_c0_g1_i1:40-735(+)